MRLFKYFVVGGVAASVDIGLFYLLVAIAGLPWMIVSVCSFVLATLANYALSIYFVFESGTRYKKHIEIIGVFILSSTALLTNQLILFLCIEYLHWHFLFSKIIATGAVFFWNYFGRSYFIFSKRT